MPLDGRISADCLIHDTSDDGERLKVLSLRSTTPITTGEAVIVTGTCGTGSLAILYSTYRNGNGDLVELNFPTHLAFAWSGSARTLRDTGDDGFKVTSANGEVAVTRLPRTEPIPFLSGGADTGTYTLIMWGPH